ncbi:MAG: hypothetical protein JWN94_732 [Betaproteobacteria bacterium]|nr:hypothetical protein [Betaproteobacteria bacterium]
MIAGFQRETDVNNGMASRDPAQPASEGIDEAGEVIYPDDIDDWAERLEVTAEQLRAAMRRVGPRADDVERYLGNPDVV